MLYRLLRVIARVALRWYYAEIVVQGAERVPRTGPLLIVANHPNALIDPLLVGTTVSRRVLMTAKATLFDHPALSMLLQAVGVVPLRRSKDESRGEREVADSARNAEAFQSVTKALRRDAAVLIFPEGISHDNPAMAPLRSGAARMALQAHSSGVRELRLLAIGLIFAEKERPNSDVLVRVGEPVVLDSWLAAGGGQNVGALTQAIETQLRAVTLNFATAERAARAVRLARILSALATDRAPVNEPRPLDAEADLANRIDRATSALAAAPPALVDAADELSARLYALQRELDRLGVGLEDVRISTRWPDGTQFLVREVPIFLLATVALALGWLTHWIPLRVARMFALGSLRRDRSRDQPAMRTIVFGLAAIVAWYVIQLVLLTYLIGLPGALIWLLTTFSAAHVLRLRGGRLRRALCRARAFLTLRSDRALQERLIADMDALVARAEWLEHALLGEPSARP